MSQPTQPVHTAHRQLEEPDRLPSTSRCHDPRMIGVWKTGRTIGKGSSGRVRIARHYKTGQYAAIKIVSKTSLVNSRISLADLEEEADRILLGIEREIVIMKLIDHPNIMHLYDVWETSGELYMVLEYVEGGELFDYICEKGRLPADEALNYFQQIISAVDYCHRFNIAHRDLKPENLLLDNKKNIKVADFGMAAWQNSSAGALLETSCGSPHYAAPEVVMGKLYDGFSSDIWSCGVVLYALLVGRLPFDDEEGNTIRLLEKVKLAKFAMPTDIPSGAQDLLRKMLAKDVSKRISMKDILIHPWFTSQPPLHTYVPPPPLGDIAKPVTSASEIDVDIFANMRILWLGTSDEDIIEGLTNEKQTWEKAVYHLLLQYRAKRLENYAGDDHAKSRQRKRLAKPSTKALVPPEIGNNSSITPSQSWDATSTIPPRPDPPTPRRASNPQDRQGLESPSPTPERQALALKTSSSGPRLPPLSARSSGSSDSACSPISPMSPVWDALNMAPIESPALHSPKIQSFFQQIVEQLDIMQQRQSTEKSSKASIDVSREPGRRPYIKVLESYRPVLPPPTPAYDDIFDDFLLVDTDEAHGITFSSISSHHAEKIPRISIGQSLGLGISSFLDTDMSQDARPPSPPASVPSSIVQDGAGPTVRLLGGILRKTSLRSSGDEKKKIKFAETEVHIVMPAEQKRIGRVRSVGDPIMSPASDHTFVLPGTSLPRRSWFGNLFKFNPASYQLFSTQDLENTRDECRRLLAGFGVQSVLIQSEGMGVLKCKLNEIRDPAGVMAVIKAVRFRVEFHAATPYQAAAGHSVVLSLVQEKGALSTFKLLFGRLQRDWVLDGSMSPFAITSPAFTKGERLVDVDNLVGA